ncbi:MAG: hypothetical protein ACE37F_19670 [Nannocystaceae bacterium]|nr:hypothetical protein [bacterium]
MDELYTLETPSYGLDSAAQPRGEELTARGDPQAGGTCPSHAPLDCGDGCCPNSHPYCCPANQCGSESTCGSGGGGGGDSGGGGGGGCDPGATPCDGGCCPAGSVCGTPGTNTCCPSEAPYHCATQGTCSTNSSDPCGGGGDDGNDSGNGSGNGNGNGNGSDSSGGGGGSGGGGTCSADASGYPGLPADIQIWSQCAAACSYCGVGDQGAVDATCSILAGWDASYPGACSYCNQDCSTPTGDQGDPGSVSTDNDDSAGLCTLGRGSSPAWGGTMLMLLLGLRRRRSGRVTRVPPDARRRTPMPMVAAPGRPRPAAPRRG